MYEIFTATMSHEMRTPLNTILSLIIIVLEGIKDSKLEKLMRIIKSSS